MMTKIAIVTDYQLGVATVKCQSQSACNGCVAKNVCGTSALAKLTGEKGEYIFTLKTVTPLAIGQTVEIGLAESSLLRSALLFYMVPLLVILLATFIGTKLFVHELISAAFIFLMTLFSYVVVRFYAQKLSKKASYEPVLLRVL